MNNVAQHGFNFLVLVNKTEAIGSLKKAIEGLGKPVDDDICDRLTGKAAVYITSLLG